MIVALTLRFCSESAATRSTGQKRPRDANDTPEPDAGDDLPDVVLELPHVNPAYNAMTFAQHLMLSLRATHTTLADNLELMCDTLVQVSDNSNHCRLLFFFFYKKIHAGLPITLRFVL